MTLSERFVESWSETTGAHPPFTWDICDTCRGHGTSTGYLGDVTNAIAEDPDFGDDYWRGVYDRACEECGGSGKVKVFAGAAAEEFAEWVREEAADRAVRFAESGYRY